MDVREFLIAFDPSRLPRNTLQDLCGKLVLKFEEIQTGDVPLHPQLRILLRRMHAIRPWSGLFLNLDHPIGCAGPFNNFPLLAVGLCLSNFKLGLWDSSSACPCLKRCGEVASNYRQNISSEVLSHQI